MADDRFLRRAIALARDGMTRGRGGPFGAVIVKDGEIIAEGCNQVTSTHDPTAHAEVVAIRNAGSALTSFSLSGCTIYSSCEPCPMCLTAIYWARLDGLYFAASRADAAAIGFDDADLYREINRAPETRRLPTRQALRDEATQVMRGWLRVPAARRY